MSVLFQIKTFAQNIPCNLFSTDQYFRTGLDLSLLAGNQTALIKKLIRDNPKYIQIILAERRQFTVENFMKNYCTSFQLDQISCEDLVDIFAINHKALDDALEKALTYAKLGISEANQYKLEQERIKNNFDYHKKKIQSNFCR